MKVECKVNAMTAKQSLARDGSLLGSRTDTMRYGTVQAL